MDIGDTSLTLYAYKQKPINTTLRIRCPACELNNVINSWSHTSYIMHTKNGGIVKRMRDMPKSRN